MRTIHAERADEHGDLHFRLPGRLVRFRALKPLPNLRWIIPLPRHMHVAYGPDPNGWRCEPTPADPSILRLFVPRRYRIACWLLRRDIDSTIVAEMAPY